MLPDLRRSKRSFVYGLLFMLLLVGFVGLIHPLAVLSASVHLVHLSAGRWQLRMRKGVFNATPQGITLRSSPERYTHKPGQSREERNPDNYVVLIFSSCMLMPLGSETSRWPRLSATGWCCRPTAASSSSPASCISTASTASRAPPAKR